MSQSKQDTLFPEAIHLIQEMYQSMQQVKRMGQMRNKISLNGIEIKVETFLLKVQEAGVL